MFEQKVLENIRKNELIQQNSSLLVGVSGGPDSLVLLHFLHTIKDRFGLKLICAHVDHMFRGEESFQDYLYVEKICREWGIPFEGKRINVPEYIKETAESTQLAARKLRFAFFEEMMKKHQISELILAHHGDDQMETMLMRMTRGATGAARAGMAGKRSFGSGFVTRPFLVVSKAEIIDYAQKNNLVPRMDPSNEKNDYVRNRFRHMILPFLKQENPQVHEHFQRFSEELLEDEQWLQEMASSQLDKVLLDQNTIDLEMLQTIPKPLQRRMIQLILNYLYIKRPSSLSAVHIDQLSALFFNPQPSAELHLPDGLIAEKSYGTCTFRFFQRESPEYFLTLHIPGEIILPNGYQIKAHYKEEKPLKGGNQSFFLPAASADLPLIVRTRREGDRIAVKGLGGTKKLKDIFINEKIPQPIRNIWPVVTDQSGEILWIPGLKKSNLESEAGFGDSFIYLEYNKV